MSFGTSALPVPCLVVVKGNAIVDKNFNPVKMEDNLKIEEENILLTQKIIKDHS